MEYVSDGFRYSVSFYINHYGGRQHAVEEKAISVDPKDVCKKVLKLVDTHNDSIIKQIVASPEKKESLKKELKTVTKITHEVPLVITFKYKEIFLYLPLNNYYLLKNKRYLIIYWYGKLHFLPNTEFIRTFLSGEPEDVFIVDSDWIIENVNIDTQKKVEVYCDENNKI